MSRYLILPANASHDVYPENANHNYKIKLPERMRLAPNQWEIALRAITYPNNWHNLCNGTMRLGNKQTIAIADIKVRDGRYRKGSDLIAGCNAAIAEAGFLHAVSFDYIEVEDKAVVTITDPNYALKLGNELASLLGFVANRRFSTTGDSNLRVKGESVLNLDNGYDNLYVYCNLCENRIVGDSSVPCLHNIPVRTIDGPSNLVHELIRNPAYVAVAGTDTDTVEIDIRRGDGEPVLFRGGCVIATVHLRKKA